MNSKRWLHHMVRVTRGLKVWQLLVLFGLMLFVSATLLRLNNLGMVAKRDAVLAADKKNDQTALRQALVDLQQYVGAHMNANLHGGLYLQDSYNRAQDAALAAQADTNADQGNPIYQQAIAECRGRFRGGSVSYQNDYLPCIIAKLGSALPGADPSTALKLPRADLYRYDFVSPPWSPDLAGFAVLLTAVICLIIIGRIVLAGAAYLVLKRHTRMKYS